MKKEKKINSKQKIALERIYRLFELAKEMNNSTRKDKEKYVKRYLSLSKKIGEKLNVSIPKELKKSYCKKCFSMKIKTTEKNPFLIVYCNGCGFEKKIGLELENANKY